MLCKTRKKYFFSLVLFCCCAIPRLVGKPYTGVRDEPIQVSRDVEEGGDKSLIGWAGIITAESIPPFADVTSRVVFNDEFAKLPKKVSFLKVLEKVPVFKIQLYAGDEKSDSQDNKMVLCTNGGCNIVDFVLSKRNGYQSIGKLKQPQNTKGPERDIFVSKEIYRRLKNVLAGKGMLEGVYGGTRYVNVTDKAKFLAELGFGLPEGSKLFEVRAPRLDAVNKYKFLLKKAPFDKYYLIDLETRNENGLLAGLDKQMGRYFYIDLEKIVDISPQDKAINKLDIVEPIFEDMDVTVGGMSYKDITDQIELVSDALKDTRSRGDLNVFRFIDNPMVGKIELKSFSGEDSARDSIVLEIFYLNDKIQLVGGVKKASYISGKEERKPLYFKYIIEPFRS